MHNYDDVRKMKILNIPAFIFVAVCFELAWAVLLRAVSPFYRRLTQKQVAAAVDRDEPPPEFVAVPWWLRCFEILFATTHIVALALIVPKSPGRTSSTLPVLCLNCPLIALLLYFFI